MGTAYTCVVVRGLSFFFTPDSIIIDYNPYTIFWSCSFEGVHIDWNPGDPTERSEHFQAMI